MTTIVSTILKYNTLGTAGIVGENPYKAKAKFSEIAGLEYTDKLNTLTKLKFTVANNEYTRANAFIERNAYFPLITPYRGMIIDSAKDKESIELNSTELAFHLTRRVFRNDGDDEVSYTTEKWYNKLWGHRAKYTVKKDHIVDTIKNIPINVNLGATESFRVHAQLNGDDFVVTSKDGVTKIPHEIQNYDSITGELVLWIKLPKLSDSSNTDFYIYYDNPAATNQEDIVNVWKNCYTSGEDDNEIGFDYNMVQHLQKDAGNPDSLDSTENDNDGTNTNITYVPGQIGNAAQFNALTSEIDCGADSTIANIFKGNSRSIDTVLGRPGTNANLLGTLFYSKVTGLIKGSKINKVQLGANSTFNSVRIKLYDHINGKPLNLLVETGALTPSSTGVTTFDLPTSIIVPDNSIVWVGVEVSGNTIGLDGTPGAGQGPVTADGSFYEETHTYGDGPTAATVTNTENSVWAALIEETQIGGGWFSAWINPNSDGENDLGMIYSKDDVVSFIQISDEVSGFCKLRFFKKFTGGGNDGDWITTTAIIPINKPSKIDIIFNETDYNNLPVFYFNGEITPITVTEQATTNTPDSDAAEVFTIGNEPGGARTFDGEIEEVRLMNVIPPDVEDIIKTNYNIENQPAVCISVHSHEEYARQADLIAEDIIDSANQDMPILESANIPGLIGAWKFDRNLLDSKGGVNTFVINLISFGVEDYGDGFYSLDKSFKFDGGTWMDAPGAMFDFNFLDEFTVSFRYKGTNAGAFVFIGNTNAIFAGTGWCIGQRSADQHFRFTMENGSGQGIDYRVETTDPGAHKLNDNEWHTITVAKGQSGNGSDLDFYQDGIGPMAKVISIDNQTGSAITTDPLRIGATSADGSIIPNGGFIDDVLIYNRRITPKEAKLIHDATQSGLDIQSRHMKWKVGEGESLTIPDLVSLYKFEQDLIDSKGENELTLRTGVETFVDNGKYGRAVSFDGATGYFHNGELVTDTTTYAVTAWVRKASGALISTAAVYSEEDQASGTEVKLVYYGDDVLDSTKCDIRIFQRDSTNVSNDDRFDTGILQTDIGWHYIVWNQLTATSYDVWVDGVKVGSKTALSLAGSYTPTEAAVGMRAGTLPAGQFYTGGVDDVRTYSRNLTDKEIQMLYLAGDSGIDRIRLDGFPTATTNIGFNFKKGWEALDELALQVGKDLWFDNKNFIVNIGTKGKVIDEKLDIIITSKPEKKTENFANIINVVGKKETGGTKLKTQVVKETVQRYNYEKVISNNKIAIQDQLGTIADSLIAEFQVLTPQIRANIPYDQFMRFDIQSGDTIKISEPDKDINGVFRFIDIKATRQIVEVTLQSAETGLVRHKSSSLSGVLSSVLKKLNEDSLSS